MAIESLYQVLLRPHMSEKATALQEKGHYSFVVATDATKRDVKKAVETVFKVTVLNVRIMNRLGKKVTQQGRAVGQRISFKKATVRLKAGDKIDVI